MDISDRIDDIVLRLTGEAIRSVGSSQVRSDVSDAMYEATRAIGDLIVDAQASEGELARQGVRRAFDGHDIDSGGNCRKAGCRWFSDGDRRHNEPGEEPEEPRGSVWD